MCSHALNRSDIYLMSDAKEILKGKADAIEKSKDENNEEGKGMKRATNHVTMDEPGSQNTLGMMGMVDDMQTTAIGGLVA
jgi:hypothetical protein